MQYNVIPIHPAHTGDDLDFSYRNRDVESDQTFKRGAPLIAGTVPTEVKVGLANSTTYLGFSLAAADDYSFMSGQWGDVKPHVPFATADQEFRGTLSGTNSASSPVTISNVKAEVGAEYGLVVDTATGFWVVNKADTTNKRVRITAAEGVNGDANIPVRFIVIPSARGVIS